MFDIIFQKLPYPLASALVRGIRTLVAILMSAIIAYITTGGLTHDLTLVSPSQAILIVMIVSPLITGFDKWLREHGLEADQKELATSVAGNGPAPNDVLAEPPADIPPMN